MGVIIHRRTILLAAAVLLLAACQSAAPGQLSTPTVPLDATAAPASTSTPTLEPSPTPLPTQTPTPANTATPTITPTPSITPFPWSSQVIAPDNAASLALRGTWGRGAVENYSASTNGYAAVKTHSGVFLYRIGDPEPIAYYDGASGFLPSPGWDYLLLHYPDSSLKLARVSDGGILHSMDSIVTVPRFYPENYTPEMIAEVAQMNHEISTAEFSQDGKWLAVAYGEGRIGVWSTEDGSLRQNLFREMVGITNDVAFSPDGSRLACAGYKGWRGGMLSMWDLTSGELIWYIPQAGRLSENPFSPDGSLITTLFLRSYGSTENVVLRQAKDGTDLGSTSGHISDAPYSADGTLLAVSNRFDVKIIKISPDFKILRTLRTGIEDSQVRFDPTAADPTVILNYSELWSVGERQLIGPYQGEVPPVAPFISTEEWAALGHLSETIGMVVPDSDAWYLWGGNGPYWRWQPLTGKVDWVSFDGETLNLPTLSPSGSLMAACVRKNQVEKYITLYSFADQTTQTVGRCDYPASIAISPDEKSLVYTISTRVELVSLDDSEDQHRLSGHRLKPSYLAFSADGLWLASEGYDTGGGVASETLLWSMDPVQGVKLEENTFHERGGGLGFSAGSDLLVSNSGRLWQTGTGIIRYLRWDEDPAASAFSPDGAYLAAALQDGTLQFYSLPEGELLWESPEGSLAQPVSLRFTPDGKNLILATADGVVRLLGIP